LWPEKVPGTELAQAKATLRSRQGKAQAKATPRQRQAQAKLKPSSSQAQAKLKPSSSQAQAKVTCAITGPKTAGTKASAAQSSRSVK